VETIAELIKAILKILWKAFLILLWSAFKIAASILEQIVKLLKEGIDKQ